MFVLCSDETQFRNCIVWLEDQKIRHYKIEERGNLRNIPSSDWPKAYEKVRPSNVTPIVMCVLRSLSFLVCLSQYLQDLNCPFGVQERKEAVDWLLGLAVRYEYGDNGKTLRRFKLWKSPTAEVLLLTSRWVYDYRN